MRSKKMGTPHLFPYKYHQCQKIAGDLVNTELSEILPDLSEFKRELQEISAEPWLDILQNAENILGVQF